MNMSMKQEGPEGVVAASNAEKRSVATSKPATCSQDKIGSKGE